jgi:alpha-mannosidase/mannosylglycerate hydrolase
MQFEYAVYPHQGNVNEAQVCQKSDIYNSDLISCTTDQHNGVITESPSFYKAKAS